MDILTWCKRHNSRKICWIYCFAPKSVTVSLPYLLQSQFKITAFFILHIMCVFVTFFMAFCTDVAFKDRNFYPPQFSSYWPSCSLAYLWYCSTYSTLHQTQRQLMHLWQFCFPFKDSILSTLSRWFCPMSPNKWCRVEENVLDCILLSSELVVREWVTEHH